MKKVYLDWAASAPVKPEVQKIVSDFLKLDIGNPSSIHSFGQAERKIIDDTKLKIATWLGVEAREVYFSSGATESINWAIQGYASTVPDSYIISTPAEHKAVLAAIAFCQTMGAKAELLPVDKFGRIDIRHLEQLLEKKPNSLVSIIYVNNETGNIEDISTIGTLIHKRFPQARLHIDATQALGWLDCNQKNLHYHYLTGAGHKLGGLKGIGILIIKKGYEEPGLIHGGGQEFDLRGGTENVPGILSFQVVAKDFSESQKQHIVHLYKTLLGKIKKISDFIINSDLDNCVKHIINVAFAGIDGEALMMSMDLRGFAISTGSACTTGATSASHVLLASGISEATAKGSIRISFGPDTELEDINDFGNALLEEVVRLRKISGYGI